VAGGGDNGSERITVEDGGLPSLGSPGSDLIYVLPDRSTTILRRGTRKFARRTLRTKSSGNLGEAALPILIKFVIWVKRGQVADGCISYK